MRCRVCGSNNEDGSKFCWNCGNKLTEQSETRSSSVNQPGIQQNSGDVQHNQVGTPPKQVRMPQRQVPPGGFDWENGKKMAEERLQKGKNIADGCVGQLKRVAENQTITDKLKKISKKTWGIIGACVALVLVLLIVIALHKPTVNLNDYLKVTYGGYDGGGVAYTEIDWNSMKEDFENKISYKRGMAQTGGMTPIDIIMEYTNANIEGKNEKLSNGDKVSYTWKVDKDAIAKLIKCKIKYSDGSKKVSGLKEMELFDPFKNLKVTFSGVEPNGEADIEYNGDMLSEYDFTCDKTSGLKNGDKIKISLTEDAGYYVDQYNKAPSVLEKEYKVKNLGKYLSKIKEVDTDGMNSARAKAQKSISDMVDYWSEDVTLDKVSYAGDYLQVAKDSDDYTKNYYGVIYQINAHIQPDGGQRKDVVSYYSMKFENVIVGGDGKCEIDLDEYDVPYDDFSVEVTSGDLSSGSYSFDGYQTLEELKKNYVDEVADEFDCEWDVSGKLEAVDLGVTSDYLCSYSSDRLLTDSDVEGYLNANYSEYNFPEGINIIQMIINEIYAKHGYEFTDSKLSAYFSNKTWYKSNTNKDIDGLTFEDAYERLAVQISNLYKEHTYLLESERMDSDDRTLFKELKSGSAGKIQIGQSLHTMSTALKDNTTLRFAVITGCLKIAKESIFTGTNNFVPDNITDSRFNEYFGFTQEEVD